MSGVLIGVVDGGCRLCVECAPAEIACRQLMGGGAVVKRQRGCFASLREFDGDGWRHVGGLTRVRATRIISAVHGTLEARAYLLSMSTSTSMSDSKWTRAWVILLPLQVRCRQSESSNYRGNQRWPATGNLEPTCR